MAQIPAFPSWLQSARVIGRNVDGEALAIGDNNGNAWLARLNRHTEVWCHVRLARQEEVDDYDNLWLTELHILGKDTRTTPPPEWRLN